MANERILVEIMNRVLLTENDVWHGMLGKYAPVHSVRRLQRLQTQF